jgi:N-acetylglucosaminyldiphosphoundecaprenol N-acetyl-beta-D-mannosaminyltransferase
LSPKLLGVPIDSLTMEQALARVEQAIASRTRLLVGVVNAAKLVSMQRDPLLQRDVLACDLILADGMSVVWASRILGQSLPERVAGIDLMLGMLRHASARGYRLYCLGATADVLASALARIAAEFPGVKIVGRRDGYFSEAEEDEIAELIRRSRPDILLVAMSSPKKERFLGRWGQSLGVPVCHGVGGSFDVLAGKVRRAPESWQRMGLEWLYRAIQEPGRLGKRYLVTNALFCRMVFAEWRASRGEPKVGRPR